MKIFDVSMTISNDMQVFNDNPEIKPCISIPYNFANDGFHESRINMSLHTGTHIDAPLHMLENGNTIESLDLSRVLTTCRLIDLTEVSGSISKNDLINRKIKPGEFILLKTHNSYEESFNPDFVYLNADGAAYLKETGIIGVGIDALSIERSQSGFETHKTLLEKGLVILEGLRLKDVSEGEYFLCSVPLKISGAEASPVRAVLFTY